MESWAYAVPGRDDASGITGSTPFRAERATVMERAATMTKTAARKIHARLVSSDGRVLIARGTGTSALTWLVDSNKVGDDSTHFTVTFKTAGAAGGMNSAVITDWKGRCLSLTGRESSIPLDFGSCDREPLLVWPAPDARIASGQAGFWLLTKLGRVGPTKVSPLLVPRSPLRIWFRLQPSS